MMLFHVLGSLSSVNGIIQPFLTGNSHTDIVTVFYSMFGTNTGAHF